jgi:hypothetical protein
VSEFADFSNGSLRGLAPRDFDAVGSKRSPIGTHRKHVYPGHGPLGDSTTLDWAIKYMIDYAKAIEPPATKEQMMERMLALYPDLRMPELLCCTLGPSLSSDEFKVLKSLPG